jgi:hypothetical protein
MVLASIPSGLPARRIWCGIAACPASPSPQNNGASLTTSRSARRQSASANFNTSYHNSRPELLGDLINRGKHRTGFIRVIRLVREIELHVLPTGEERSSEVSSAIQ